MNKKIYGKKIKRIEKREQLLWVPQYIIRNGGRAGRTRMPLPVAETVDIIIIVEQRLSEHTTNETMDKKKKKKKDSVESQQYKKCWIKNKRNDGMRDIDWHEKLSTETLFSGVQHKTIFANTTKNDGTQNKIKTKQQKKDIQCRFGFPNSTLSIKQKYLKNGEKKTKKRK